MNCSPYGKHREQVSSIFMHVTKVWWWLLGKLLARGITLASHIIPKRESLTSHRFESASALSSYYSYSSSSIRIHLIPIDPQQFLQMYSWCYNFVRIYSWVSRRLEKKFFPHLALQDIRCRHPSHGALPALLQHLPIPIFRCAHEHNGTRSAMRALTSPHHRFLQCPGLYPVLVCCGPCSASVCISAHLLTTLGCQANVVCWEQIYEDENWQNKKSQW